MTTLEQVWAQREELVYPELFGPTDGQIYPLSTELFVGVFQQDSIDPRWLHIGVFQIPPTPTRSTWIYVSSGLSNPWEDDPEQIETRDYSGLGVELVLETPTAAIWPIVIMQRMLAFDILLAHGRFGAAQPLDYGDRIPLRGSVALEQPSALEYLIIAQPNHYPASFHLASGRVDLLHFIGMSNSELAYAKATSSADLIARFRAEGVYPLTDPERASIISE
jgi:hypothetical protein